VRDRILKFSFVLLITKGGIVMARIARIKSKTGIYHVMLRGIDKRNIFLDKKEYLAFLKYIQKTRGKINFTVYAYCLMTNHVHILLKTEEMPGDIIKRIAIAYAQYHNIKNGRTGHLFQNRFKSEAVDTERYFLTVLRYINQNPIKAGIVEKMMQYKWSSYHEYFINEKMIVDTEFIPTYFRSLKDFMKFMEEANEDECLDYNPTKRWTNDELIKYINQIIDLNALHNSDRQVRNEMLKMIKIKTTASNRQLSNVLGIGRGVLEKIK